jgi:hypothetical protein
MEDVIGTCGHANLKAKLKSECILLNCRIPSRALSWYKTEIDTNKGQTEIPGVHTSYIAPYTEL